MVLRKPAEHNKSLIVEPIVQGTTKSGFMADRYLVFCRTYPETVELFQEAVLQLTTKMHCMFLPHHQKPGHIAGYVKKK